MYIRFISALGKIVKSGSVCVRTRQVSTTTNKTREIEERKIKVDDMEINYVKVGTGDHPVLLLPGAMGTIWTDFRPQIENLNRDKLTIVAWDPPGYGKSRPPDRTFPDDFFQRDATWAYNLMNALGYLKFSLVGWCHGSISSLLLAAMYPVSIRKMIVIGANVYVYPEEAKVHKDLRDINMWSKEMKAPMLQVYNEDYFKKTWANMVDFMMELYEKQNGNVCKQVLSKIKCPTLIVHGAKDPVILLKHSTYLKQNIADSNVHIFEKGAHNLHLRYPEEFNSLVTNFLVS